MSDDFRQISTFLDAVGKYQLDVVKVLIPHYPHFVNAKVVVERVHTYCVDFQVFFCESRPVGMSGTFCTMAMLHKEDLYLYKDECCF